jgi:regulator of replication initiation timing
VDLNQALKDIQVSIDDLAPSIRSLLTVLFNKIEELSSENQTLKAEIQNLRDENNRLKGEQGKPDIRPQTSSKDFSSEKERKDPLKKKQKKSKAKNHKITINRTRRCPVDKSKLPADAAFKGLASVIVQDLIITPDNIEFEKEIYYSPSLKKTYTGNVPAGYEGEFGPGIKTYILNSYHNSKMSHSAIAEALQTYGIEISACTVSRLLTDNQEAFHQEKQDIVEAGLASGLPQQMDDTGGRMKGKNCFVHILCNVLYAAFFTRPNKTRLTILEILAGNTLSFKFNETAYALMEQMKLPNKAIQILRDQKLEGNYTRQDVDGMLAKMYPNPEKNDKNRKTILEASGIAAYQESLDAVSILLVDDAPQFKGITALLALCWIHEGRHYKKLTPYLYLHQQDVDNFLDKFWEYYKRLLTYKTSPDAKHAKALLDEFDVLFATQTGYDALDKRIAMTKAKKEYLLLVLKHPEIPLHNNTAEIAARSQARKRDSSFHTMSRKGTEAKDTFMTIVETAKKHGVNIYNYLYDRITKKYTMPSLATLIKQSSIPIAA